MRRRFAGVLFFFVNAPSLQGVPMMTRNLWGSVLIAAILAATWATSSEACHRRRGCGGCGSGYYGGGCGGGYYGGGCGGGYAYGGGGYYAAGQGYSGGGYAGYPAGYGGYGGYDFGRPGYNPGGLGGPASGLGVRPGLGFGGFGPGR